VTERRWTWVEASAYVHGAARAAMRSYGHLAAEDVAQEALLSAVRISPDAPPPPEVLQVVVSRRVVDAVRVLRGRTAGGRRARGVRVSIDHWRDTEDGDDNRAYADVLLGVELPYDAHVAWREAVDAVAALPPRERRVVAEWLVGTPFSEVARALAVCDSRVSQLLARALRRVRAQLDDGSQV
jgi:RNA polymerase sigma factor (sigma-70 family)